MTNARELSNRLAELLHQEHHALAEFILALADFDRERRWLELGHASLFNFLHHELGLSKGAAYYRMTAARLVQRHPEIVEPLRDGRLCLTNVVELSKVRTVVTSVPSDHLVRMPASATAQPAMQLTRVSWLDEPAHANSERSTQEGPAHSVTLLASAPSAPPSAAPTVVEPKTAELSRVHITVSREFLRKLDAARDALSHSHPGATEQTILEVGLDLVLERSARRKGLVTRPRPAPAQPGMDRYSGKRRRTA